MRLVKAVLVCGMCVLAIAATTARLAAQETGIRVRSIRVLATDPEALATFYKKAFGMSETRRPVDSPTFKEIVVNSGSTVEIARKSTSTPIVIASRGKEPVTGGMAALIVQVPDIDKAIAQAKAAGATLLRGPSKSGEGLGFAFLKDPDGNQFELVMSPK